MTKKNLIEAALVEMGKRVGLEWSGYDDVMAYQHREGVQWYLSRSWTDAEQKSFEQWMDSMLKQKTSWSRQKRFWEVKEFILCYGWRIK